MQGAYEQLSAENRRKVDSLLSDTDANGGLAPLDLDAFWQDQDTVRVNLFGKDIPQIAFGASCTNECVFAELNIEENYQLLYNDRLWRAEISRRYNDVAEKIVGRRILNETLPQFDLDWPEIKGLHDIFEARNVWEGGKTGSWWLQQATDSTAGLAALLDRVEERLENLRDFILPDNWDEEKKRLTAMGSSVPLYRGQRGPCTFACSIFGVENLLVLPYDDPGLFARFSEILGRAILARAEVLDDEAGLSGKKVQGGWGWADDNCCLFTPDMYERFAMPIHRAVFLHYAPEPGHRRYQHSDSDMAHLLPLLAELNLTGTNFGPSLTVAEIRRHCPNAVIDGQLAPFTFSRNEEANMVAELLRDFEQAKGNRGLNFSTAGSVNNGSRLSGMRLMMAATQRYARYDKD